MIEDTSKKLIFLENQKEELLLKEIDRYEKKKLDEQKQKEEKKLKMLKEIEEQLKFSIEYKKELKEKEKQAGIEFK